VEVQQLQLRECQQQHGLLQGRQQGQGEVQTRV
jgi:hypothetical protein